MPQVFVCEASDVMKTFMKRFSYFMKPSMIILLLTTTA
jgi:hypothetical protein